MCGFIGILSEKHNWQDHFDTSFAAIWPRGTTNDQFHGNNESYGYARLPTDDIHNDALNQINGARPSLLFNGLITNADELAVAFKLSEGAEASDTQCLREGLAATGKQFVKHLRGMFAFAGITETEVTLVRDGIGVKPLYYVFEGGDFAFASEQKALQLMEATIHEVQPGQIVTYSKLDKTIARQRYDYVHRGSDAPHQLLDCLHASVIRPTERYLAHSQKKVGLLLSGGLDSSLTAGLMAKFLPPRLKQKIQAFCIGEPRSQDIQAAKQLADQLGFPLIEVRPYSVEASMRMLPEIVYQAESPHARVIKVALLYDALAKAIQKAGIEVVVGGEGADELFFGYQRFIDGLTHEQSEELFSTFFSGVFPHTLLQRFDRIMARHQIEGRVPYLDQELICLARQIPPAEKVIHSQDGNEYVSKQPLRVLAREIGLPAYIYDRPKEKMTSGATGYQNEAGKRGYLEDEAFRATGMYFQEAVVMLYKLYFGDRLSQEDISTEDRVMHVVAHYRALNNQKLKQLERSRA
ncbi:MAG TPA: asparagine synthase-related protein [Candidatus Saccharimonadales bacterium]